MSPHFSFALFSSIGTPLILTSRKYTNIGEIHATFSNPVKQDMPKNEIPVHRSISPK